MRLRFAAAVGEKTLICVASSGRLADELAVVRCSWEDRDRVENDVQRAIDVEEEGDLNWDNLLDARIGTVC